MAHVANVVIDNTKVSADLTDFVVYVDLSDLPAAFWDTVANGGGDIRCFKSDGTTELAREVVSCDTATDTGELHIKFAGTLSSSVDTTIQIHADGTSSDYAVGATYGRDAVWSDYVLVFHLNETSGAFADATGGSTSAAPSSETGLTREAATKINTGISVASMPDDNIQPIPNGSTSLPINAARSEFTISAWGSRVGATAGPNLIFDFGGSGNGAALYYRSVPDTLHFGINANSSSSNSKELTSTTTYADGSGVEFLLHGTYDAGNLALFVNGVSEDTDTISGPFNSNTGSVLIGSRPSGANDITFAVSSTGSTQPWDGLIDECRVCSKALSSAWISTEYNNQNSPSTFYTASAVSALTTFVPYGSHLISRQFATIAASRLGGVLQ